MVLSDILCAVKCDFFANFDPKSLYFAFNVLTKVEALNCRMPNMGLS
jgi:hypothetical protein